VETFAPKNFSSKKFARENETPTKVCANSQSGSKSLRESVASVNHSQKLCADL
jgi:hypothetical protein